MASLTGATIAATYTSLLKLSGNTDSLVAGGSDAIQVVDGNGTVSALYLNTDRVGIGRNDPTRALSIQETNSGSLAVALNIRNSSSADGTSIAMDWEALDIGGSLTTTLGRITCTLDDRSEGAEKSEMTFLTTIAGALAERMRIGEDGFLGIGTQEPGNYLEVSSASGTNAFIEVTSPANYDAGIMLTEGSTEQWRIYNDGDSSPSDNLVIAHTTSTGVVYLTQGTGGTNATHWANVSDERLKENFIELESATEKLNSLRCVEFNYKETPDLKQIGLIAQDVYKVYPYAVDGTPNKTIEYREGKPPKNAMGLSYQDLISPMIKAIQELSAKVAALENA